MRPFTIQKLWGQAGGQAGGKAGAQEEHEARPAVIGNNRIAMVDEGQGRAPAPCALVPPDCRLAMSSATPPSAIPVVPAQASTIPHRHRRRAHSLARRRSEATVSLPGQGADPGVIGGHTALGVPLALRW